MKELQKQKGFTLVELAIVLTIIGLLIGGILKGQQLMQNARVTATMAQVQAIDAATTTFRDTYGQIPGDMPSPNTRLSGFQNALVSTALGGGSTGDGIVGVNNWDMGVADKQSSIAVASPSVTVQNEALFFWSELSAAGVLSSITYTGGALVANSAAFGTTNPPARVGGGWIVATSPGTASQPLNPAVALGANHIAMGGIILVLTSDPNAVLPTATGTLLLNPSTAAQIDRKMDDGNPLTGAVQAYGFDSATAATGCFNSAATPIVYNESLSAKDCSLFFKIQG